MVTMWGGHRPCTSPFYPFSIVHSSGCWFSLEYSFTCATLDSATLRVYRPQTPRRRGCGRGA